MWVSSRAQILYSKTCFFAFPQSWTSKKYCTEYCFSSFRVSPNTELLGTIFRRHDRSQAKWKNGINSATSSGFHKLFSGNLNCNLGAVSSLRCLRGSTVCSPAPRESAREFEHGTFQTAKQIRTTAKKSQHRQCEKASWRPWTQSGKSYLKLWYVAQISHLSILIFKHQVLRISKAFDKDNSISSLSFFCALIVQRGRILYTRTIKQRLERTSIRHQEGFVFE